MKPKLIDRASHQNCSFTISHHIYPHFLKVWHYHPEIELVSIERSTGLRFVGDNVEKFEPGDLVMIGNNLPHLWRNDDIYFNESSNLQAEALVIHFGESLGVDNFFEIPELKSILKLLQRGRRGIKFTGKNRAKVVRIMREMTGQKNLDRLLSLLHVLKLLAEDHEYQMLASEGFINTFSKKENRRLDGIYNYIANNFKEPISLEDISKIACMNPSAFSRYFRRINQKTFRDYLNEMRVGYACKLLMEGHYSIAEVCFESGFNNISNFNRQFKGITKFSPKEYKMQFT